MAAFLVSDCFGGEDKSATLIFWQQNVKHWKSKTIKFIPRRWFLNPFEQICSSNWSISQWRGEHKQYLKYQLVYLGCQGSNKIGDTCEWNKSMFVELVQNVQSSVVSRAHDFVRFTRVTLPKATQQPTPCFFFLVSQTPIQHYTMASCVFWSVATDFWVSQTIPCHRPTAGTLARKKSQLGGA